VNPAFWQGKRVFITGHTGFKGSWLCLWLHTLGAKVTGFALPAVQQSLFNQANVAASMNSLTGDVRDLLAFKTAMAATEPEIVIHMAAQALVRESYKDPVNTYTTNVLGTVNLFEAIKSTPSVRAVVNVTTDKCYENKEWIWAYRENEPLGGYDPYSCSKACSELVAASYRQSFFSAQHFDQHGVAIATARAGNVIGGGDYAMDRLIPDIVSSFASGKTVNIRYPQAIRPWQHVLEPLNGYLMLAQALFERGPEFAEPWNFGPHLEDAQTVEWIVQHMADDIEPELRRRFAFGQRGDLISSSLANLGVQVPNNYVGAVLVPTNRGRQTQSIAFQATSGVISALAWMRGLCRPPESGGSDWRNAPFKRGKEACLGV